MLEELILPLIWSEVKKPCDECRYDHITAQTPFGDFLISWKSWKRDDSPTIDETPWGEWFAACNDVEDAKATAEAEYKNRVISLFK